jgi:DNA-binding winged helix-turn-helix (wHTH) protein
MRAMHSPHETSSFRFGLFEFSPQTSELRKHGLKIRLSPLAGKVLTLLLEHPGHVRTREGLQRRLWPANTLIDYEHSLNRAIHALREALRDSAISPRYIETIPGQGYRFIPLPQEAGPTELRRNYWESIAVLPFASECRDLDASFQGDDITSRLINSLSSSTSRLRVLAYSVVRYYMKADPHPQTVGRDLDVQGVVAGEIIRRNSQLIVRAELIDVADGHQVWGTQLKRRLEDEIEVIEQIAAEISRQLMPVLMSQVTAVDSSTGSSSTTTFLEFAIAFLTSCLVPSWNEAVVTAPLLLS